MPTPVTLPSLGDGIESGDVLEIFVSVGDVISAGQDIIEMETDKATVPVPSSVAGRVVKIHVSKGQTLPIGGVILDVEAAAGAATAAPPPATPAPAAAPTAPAAAPTAPAATPAPAPPAPAAATPAPAAPPTAETASPPPPRATPAPAPAIPPAPRPAPVAPPAPLAAPAVSVARQSDQVIAAGPAVRRFAREVGVDLATVQGSGEGGRITREDVLEVVRHASQAAHRAAAPVSSVAPASRSAPATEAPAGTPATPPLAGEPGQDDYGPVRREKMTKIRKTIAAQMHLSWTTVPRVTNFDDADITDLERLRQASKDDYAAQGLKLTTMPFVLKAVATALRHHPQLNATIDMEGESITYKDYVNLGVAVDTDRGLIVPVLRNVDRMSIPDVARALAEMSTKVRTGQFAVNELRGGTFTISNLGAIGGQYSTPIINVPEVAILLVGRSRKLARVMPDDSIQARLMMPLSLAYDHRLVDGGVAARFLNDIIGYLEAPSRLLLAL
jgi:pyruvate dehydrogenase E2 component (dihydrolipoamide acetyltransferase)